MDTHTHKDTHKDTHMATHYKTTHSWCTHPALLLHDLAEHVWVVSHEGQHPAQAGGGGVLTRELHTDQA
jgi:hypothetical protein